MYRMLCVAAALSVSCGTAVAQRVVDVNDGEVLSEAEFLALPPGPDLLINVNSGGTIGELDVLDALGTTININDGGFFASGVDMPSLIGWTNLSVFAGGTIGSEFTVGFGSFMLDGGVVGDGWESAFTAVDLRSGTVGVAEIRRGTFAMSGGTLAHGSSVEDATSAISGGQIGNELVIRGTGSGQQSVTTMSGGQIGDSFQLLNLGGGGPDPTMQVSGGSIGQDAFIGTFTLLDMSSGSIGDGLSVRGTLHLSGGNVGTAIANDGYVTMTGGSVTELWTGGTVGGFDIADGTVGNLVANSLIGSHNVRGGHISTLTVSTNVLPVDLSGGVIDTLIVEAGGCPDFGGINVSGTEFYLDGVLLDDLVFDEPFTIIDRDVTLSGLLADGSFFDFDLNTVQMPRADYFAPDSRITVTLVPTPGALPPLCLAGLMASRRRRGESR